MALPERFLSELRERLPMAEVVGRKVTLVKAGHDLKGCCPFHGEKTASLYVYSDHSHCYGCGSHDDVISFVMKTEKIRFMAAIEKLAAEVGMEIPRPEKPVDEKDEKRKNISEVLNAAKAVYTSWLFGHGGEPALLYLKDRGFTEETIRKFELGWSGNGRGALAEALKDQGITIDQMIQAGLMKAGDHGPTDMYFSRIMFPIKNRKDNVVSFGGRLIQDGNPKYINGPETAAFSKKRALFGINIAAEATRHGAKAIVVEGYLDVLMLHQEGFDGAVATLGTALTADHLHDLWRLSPEPVLCFDADEAGRRATIKTVEMAFPLIENKKALRVLSLPEREDPDSLVRKQGAMGFKARLVECPHISKVFYDLMAYDKDLSVPEVRAELREKLVTAAESIKDERLASAYRTTFLERYFSEQIAIGNGPKASPVRMKFS
jgi:DNA primase